MPTVVLAHVVGRRVVGPRHELLREGDAAGLRLREHEGKLAELARRHEPVGYPRGGGGDMAEQQHRERPPLYAARLHRVEGGEAVPIRQPDRRAQADERDCHLDAPAKRGGVHGGVPTLSLLRVQRKRHPSLTKHLQQPRRRKGRRRLGAAASAAARAAADAQKSCVRVEGYGAQRRDAEQAGGGVGEVAQGQGTHAAPIVLDRGHGVEGGGGEGEPHAEGLTLQRDRRLEREGCRLVAASAAAAAETDGALEAVGSRRAEEVEGEGAVEAGEAQVGHVDPQRHRLA
mmetsp:Transcript_38331/g.124104  ORF Transcript_38331/g.124104 Transcript_38331/m.124104 type:complete len:287 (-) Transcript_38331:1123-1983(-)